MLRLVDDLPDKPLVWLHGKPSSPPMSVAARVKAGELLRRLQMGQTLSLPDSRPMPVIGPRCHELRVVDRETSWRLVYPIDPEAVVVVEVFQKTTKVTPRRVVETCRRRLDRYDRPAGGRP